MNKVHYIDYEGNLQSKTIVGNILIIEKVQQENFVDTEADAIPILISETKNLLIRQYHIDGQVISIAGQDERERNLIANIMKDKILLTETLSASVTIHNEELRHVPVEYLKRRLCEGLAQELDSLINIERSEEGYPTLPPPYRKTTFKTTIKVGI